MKKKLKVKKAALGKIIRRSIPTPTPPRPITNFGGPRPRPGVQQEVQVINGIKQLVDVPQRDPNMFLTTPPTRDPRSVPFASAVGPSMQGVGDPRLGAATIPGNQLQMQMRGPTQAAPVQPVPAMKKGGMVRGQGAAIRGTKFKGIF